jgi:hypothetical protein
MMMFNNENIYSHGSGKICNFLNRSLQGDWGFAPAMILRIFFCNVNSFLLSEKFPQKIIPYSLRSESKQKKLISWLRCCLYMTGILLHNMPRLTLRSADRRVVSTLNDYQYVSQEVLCVLILLYIYLHIQCLSEIVVNCVITFITLVLSKFRVSLFAANHLRGPE